MTFGSHPQLGYNNNVRHNGKVFHIQTEDSGARYGHIITHLFMDGGRILKSVKTSYAEYVGSERMAEIVREMMKQQHKAMFIALRDGKFDGMIDGGADASQSTKALVLESPPTPPPPPPEGTMEPTPTVPMAPRAPSADTTARYLSPVSPQTLDSEEGPPTIRQPAEELTLDIDALERAAAAANVAHPVLRTNSDLPPPPANLFREKTASGKYRVTPAPQIAALSPALRAPTPAHATPGPQRVPTPPPPRPGVRPSSMGMPAGGPMRRPSQTSLAAGGGERRYAPTRPASIFGQARPQQGKSIFGEDLISDKSLDEVILSYLAEDLDEKK